MLNKFSLVSLTVLSIVITSLRVSYHDQGLFCVLSLTAFTQLRAIESRRKYTQAAIIVISVTFLIQ